VPPTANISAVPATVAPNQTAQLNWTSQNATGCDIQPAVGPVPAQGSRSVTPTASTTYALVCEGPGGKATSSTQVTVIAPPPPPKPSCTITANPAAVTLGTPSQLNWSSQNAADCDLQPGVGRVNPQGTLSVTPKVDTTYTLNCQGAGGTATSSTAIAIMAPPEPEKPCQSMTLNVKFDTAKADVKSQYAAELQKFADILKENPKATAVIEGHTDNVGDADMNMKLSQRRADSVRGFLVDKLGVAAERLTSQGYGLTKPIAINKSAEGKAKNRRIDAHIFCGK
jgi:OOP family OmpA-OmpF porin